MLCRFTVTSPDIAIWLSVSLCCWAFILISTLILLISPPPLLNFGGVGISHCPVGCAITCTYPWEEPGKVSSAVSESDYYHVSGWIVARASWNFVLWGTFHGIALAVHKMWMSIIGRKKGDKVMAGVVYSESLSLSTLSVSAGYSS